MGSTETEATITGSSPPEEIENQNPILQTMDEEETDQATQQTASQTGSEQRNNPPEQQQTCSSQAPNPAGFHDGAPFKTFLDAPYQKFKMNGDTPNTSREEQKTGPPRSNCQEENHPSWCTGKHPHGTQPTAPKQFNQNLGLDKKQFKTIKTTPSTPSPIGQMMTAPVMSHKQIVHSRTEKASRSPSLHAPRCGAREPEHDRRNRS
jgi:hypothetical protein